MVKCRLVSRILKRKIEKGPKIMEQGAISAVHDKDLYKFLVSLGEANKVIKGKARCHFCHKRITFDNIQCIFPLNNDVKYCCTNASCYNMLLEGSIINA